MSTPLEDYALIGDMETVALVSRSGSIDWLCFPRFDSGACFAALLGNKENGHWQLAPRVTEGPDAVAPRAQRRRYLPDTMVLETEWDTPDGSVRVTDFMPPRDAQPDVVRIVEGLSGRVSMRSVLRLRFDYGWIIPWVRRHGREVSAIAGPDAVTFYSDIENHGEDFATYADFEIVAGQRARFILSWHPSHRPTPVVPDAEYQLGVTVDWWRAWTSRCTYKGTWVEAVRRSLITLKALTYEPTGGIVAAPTASLPEDLGGVRNWDYRYCWLRDATMTLMALGRSGYTEEADAWRHWLLRTIAGTPNALQIMYGIAGERRLTEFEVDWLEGYEKSRPVRVGNAAVDQLQLDVYGEVMDALAFARDRGLPYDADAWNLQVKLIGHLAEHWREPDEGIWEVRGPRQHFTHSKVMAWVAMDRAARAVEQHGQRGDAAKWRSLADEIHREVLTRAYDPRRNTFTQAYDSPALDASLLLLPQVGFLPPNDPRIVGTIDAIQRELCRDGLVMRYQTEHTGQDQVDGLPGSEGTFLACSFWLADDLHAIGRTDQARELFEQLLSLRNDVGLLAEEYDPRYQRMVGNFPQAYSHIALINSALHLSGDMPVVRTKISVPAEYGLESID
ncbi:MAG TPA: glycoside hydrolase family 15 protein [Actinopolymorphaceae bacterium]